MYYDKVVFVETLAAYANNRNQEAFITHSGFAGINGNTAAVMMNIQPASDQMTVLYEGVAGKVYVAFTAASGIVEGQRLTVSGTSEQYIVRGRKAFFYGPLPHAEVVLFKRDPL